MAKYHIRKDGTPGVCHAQEGNCPLGGSENHVEAETLEQAQRQFDKRNEHVAELNRSLLKDYDSYDKPEKEVFDKMYWSGRQETYVIDYDRLPEYIKKDLLSNSGNTEEYLRNSDIIVEHTDLSYSGNLITEFVQDEPEVEELMEDYCEKIDDVATMTDILRDEKAGKRRQEKAMKILKEYIATSDDYNYRSSFSDHGSVQVLRGSEPTAPSYEQRLEKAKSLDEYDVEEYLNNIYEEAFDIEPENAYTFSEEGDWSYEKDGIEVEYFVDTYDGEDYNTLNISDNGKLVRSFRLYPDDYDGESFDRIETVK